MKKVYFNLHRRVFSIMNPKTRRVESHCRWIIMETVFFHVSQKGRERVLRDKVKNVHAFVCGDVIMSDEYPPLYIDSCGSYVTYNPYKYSTFVNLQEQPVYHAANAKLWVEDGLPRVTIT